MLHKQFISQQLFVIKIFNLYFKKTRKYKYRIILNHEKHKNYKNNINDKKR